MIFSLPKVGKGDFRCFSVFPKLGKPIFDDFLFSPVRESRFLSIFDFPSRGIICFRRFLPVVPLRKPLFPVFCSSYPYESRFLPFFVHRTPTKASFFHFSFIVPRIWTIFPENRRFTPVSGQIFLKIDDLLSYFSSFF